MNGSAGVFCAESKKWIGVAEFLEQEKFAPRTKMLDEESRFPAESYQDLADAGLIAPFGARLSSRTEGGAYHQRPGG